MAIFNVPVTAIFSFSVCSLHYSSMESVHRDLLLLVNLNVSNRAKEAPAGSEGTK